MTEFKIDKNIPLPEKKNRYPFDELEVGESFEVPYQFRPSVQTIASSLKKNEGKEFRTKKVNHNMVRVWRVS